MIFKLKWRNERGQYILDLAKYTPTVEDLGKLKPPLMLIVHVVAPVANFSMETVVSSLIVGLRGIGIVRRIDDVNSVLVTRGGPSKDDPHLFVQVYHLERPVIVTNALQKIH